MEIIVGKKAGFCFGVKRAVEGSLKEILKEKKNVYCLGELVHNKQVMDGLISKGVILIQDIKEVPDNSKVIIRAHGAKKETYNYANNHGIELIDFTCPFVLKIHDIAKKYQSDGYYIFVVGNKVHPETIGTISYCGNNCDVIEEIDDIGKAIDNFNNSNIGKLLVIVQTTYSEKKFGEIEKIIKDKVKIEDLVIKNTICLSTSERQKETMRIAKDVDAMIIIGGKNSSNTKKLYEVSKKYCDKTILIETVNDLIDDLSKMKKVGIMAGASTPDESINDVIKKLNGDNNVS